jgi:asparagine synthase (glutamine-hydrolysing)
MLNIGDAKLGDAAFRTLRNTLPSREIRNHVGRFDPMLGGPDAYACFYDLVSAGARRFYSADLKQALGTHVAIDDYAFDHERLRRWHPLNRLLYAGYKIHLGGLLLNSKGDRVAMANSVETRYPYLDEEIIGFLARIHPRWKLKGIRQDKYLLRRVAARYLPAEIASCPKKMFRAPLATTFFSAPPDYVRELLSAEALKKTGYFDAAEVGRAIEIVTSGKGGWYLFSQMGLVGVLSTQLWHHLHLGGGLCDLPNVEPQLAIERPAAA